MEQAFEDGYVTTTGLAITKVLPPMPIFGGGTVNREAKKNTVVEKLQNFFSKFFGLFNGGFDQPKVVKYEQERGLEGLIAAEEQ